jgi:hypothetical protein
VLPCSSTSFTYTNRCTILEVSMIYGVSNMVFAGKHCCMYIGCIAWILYICKADFVESGCGSNRPPCH